MRFLPFFCRLFLALVSAYPLGGGAAPIGDQIFQKASPAVFRLLVREPDSSSVRSSGTAFAVERNGYLITNYQVVSDAVLAPGRYQLFLEMREGPVLATVESVDAIHDLALLRVPRALEETLSLAPASPEFPGETLFSLGFPHTTEKLHLAQGKYSGTKLMGMVPAMLASIPLNSGMSGGPAFDREGRVAGVNRAISARAQGISFLSPLPAVKELVASRNEGRSLAAKPGWGKEIARQLKEQESKILGDAERISRSRREKVGGITFKVPLTGIACGQEKVRKGESEIISCRTQSFAYLGGSSAGLEVLTYAVDNLPAGLRANYFRAMDSGLKRLEAENSGSRSLASAGRCGLRYVRNRFGVEMTVRFCSVLLNEFPGLFSSFLKVDIDGSSVILSQEYSGMSLSATASLVEDFLDSVQKVAP